MNYRPKLTGRCHFWFIGACAFRFVVVVSKGLFCYFLFFISFAFFWGSKGARLLFVAFSFFFSFRSVFFCVCVCVIVSISIWCRCGRPLVSARRVIFSFVSTFFFLGRGFVFFSFILFFFSLSLSLSLVRFTTCERRGVKPRNTLTPRVNFVGIFLDF